MIILILICLFTLVLILPLRHAFGINIIATFLFIVPNGQDITTYFFLIIFFRLILLKLFKNEKIKVDSFVILFSFLLFFSIISYLIFFAPSGAEYLRRYFMTIIIIFSFINIYNDLEDLKIFVGYILTGVLFLSVHIYTQTVVPINPFATAEFTAKEGRLMPRGFVNQYVNSNSIGALLVWGYGMVVGFYTLFYSKYIMKYNLRDIFRLNLWSVLLLSNMALLMGMLGSRTSFIALIITAIISLLRINISGKIFRIFFFSTMFLFFLGSNISNLVPNINAINADNIFAPLVNRLLKTNIEIEGEHEYARSNLAKNGFQLFIENPIFGVGIGNESTKMEESTGIRKVSHNTFVSLLSEMGVIGIIFLISIISIWLPYVKFSYIVNILLMIGVFATFHNILLMSIPWLFMSFSKKCFDLVQSQE